MIIKMEKNSDKLLLRLFIVFGLTLFILYTCKPVLSQNNEQEYINWVKIHPGFSTNDTLLDMSNNGVFVTENIGWFATSYPIKIFKTIDGGYHWTLQKRGAYAFVRSFFALDSLHLWVIGSFASYDSLDFFTLFTTDGGMNWDSSGVNKTGVIPSRNKPSFFFDSQEGMVYNNRSLLFTTDGGRTWTPKDTAGAIKRVLDIDFVNKRIGWMVGGSLPGNPMNTGFIAKTIDGGNTWSLLDSIKQDDRFEYFSTLSSVDFVDSLTGYTISYLTGSIYITKDGGKIWYPKYNVGGDGDIAFLDKNIGWTVGSKGKIWQTTDGGENWNVQKVGDTDLRKISILNKKKVVYIFGKENTLLRADLNTKVEGNPQIVPKYFTLLQNYPNPFNSNTTIAYTLEKRLPVQLKIFNILGEEVKMLVNEIQTSGDHRVLWDGTTTEGKEVTSCIYIYKLTAGNISAYRMMILLR